MSAERLARIDTHFRKYVDDGRLPGWLISVSRHGKLVHLSTYGHRDIEASTPVETDTLWRIFSMTKPITAVLALQLWEEGAFELNDPGVPLHPGVQEPEGVAVRQFDGAGARSGRREDAPVAPVLAHERAHLRIHVRSSRRRAVSQGRVRMGHATRSRSRGGRRQVGLAAAAVPAGHGMELLRRPRRARSCAGSHHRPAARRSDAHASARAAGHGRDDVVRRRSPRTASGRPVRRTSRRLARRCGWMRWTAAHCTSRRPTAAAAVWSAPRTTTTGSRRCCCAVASSMVCASSPPAP